MYRFKLYCFMLLTLLVLYSCEDNIREVALYEKGTIEAITSSTSIRVNESVSYEDISTKKQGLTWTFSGGNPSASFSSKVDVTYSESGVYTTNLEVKYIDNQIEKKDYRIEVYPLDAVPQSAFKSLKSTESKIQFEDFDNGGEGISYHDSDSENEGSSEYRFGHGVDIETTNDQEGSFDITATATNEWLEYTIFVENASVYDFNFRLKNAVNGTSIKIQYVNGTTITDLGTTGAIINSESYMNVEAENITLSAGRNVIRLQFSGSGIDANYFEIINTVFIPPVIKYGLYTENTSTSVEQSLAASDLSYFSGNAYDISQSTDAFEGLSALHFQFQEIDTWGVMGIMEASTPLDFSEWDYYHISLKTISLGRMRLRIRGGGVNAFVILDDAIKTYGFERDGNWYNLKIPLSDFVDADNGNALPDLTSVDRILVLRSDEGAVGAGDDWDYYVDNLYLSKE